MGLGAGQMVGFITLFIVRNFQNQMVKYGNGQGKQMIGPGGANTATVNTTK